MNIMRFTIIDKRGGTSFLAECDALFALVAACARNAKTLDEALTFASDYVPSLKDYVLNGLAVFDEHNVEDNYENIHAAFKILAPTEIPVFRVVDETTREASLHPVKAGAVLFNLSRKRIVQIQNGFLEIRRKNQIRLSGKTSIRNRVVRYELPSEWAIVP